MYSMHIYRKTVLTPWLQPAPRVIMPGWQKEMSLHRGCKQYMASWSGRSPAWCHAPPSSALGLQTIQPHHRPISELQHTAKSQCPVSKQLQEVFRNLQFHQWLRCWPDCLWVHSSTVPNTSQLLTACEYTVQLYITLHSCWLPVSTQFTCT